MFRFLQSLPDLLVWGAIIFAAYKLGLFKRLFSGSGTAATGGSGGGTVVNRPAAAYLWIALAIVIVGVMTEVVALAYLDRPFVSWAIQTIIWEKNNSPKEVRLATVGDPGLNPQDSLVVKNPAVRAQALADEETWKKQATEEKLRRLCQSPNDADWAVPATNGGFGVALAEVPGLRVKFCTTAGKVVGQNIAELVGQLGIGSPVTATVPISGTGIITATLPIAAGLEGVFEKSAQLFETSSGSWLKVPLGLLISLVLIAVILAIRPRR